MDINGILSTIGGFLGVFNVSTGAGQAFLKFVEFWLTGFQFIMDLFAKIKG